jgi:hypothetical protein
MPENVSDKLLQRGPGLWCELHRWALTTDRKDAARWLARFEARIGCGDCRRHWQAILQEQPPDLESNEMLFVWSVDMHNAINRTLNRSEMTVDEAKSYWTNRRCRQSLAARNGIPSQRITAKAGCRGCGGNKGRARISAAVGRSSL